MGYGEIIYQVLILTVSFCWLAFFFCSLKWEFFLSLHDPLWASCFISYSLCLLLFPCTHTHFLYFLHMWGSILLPPQEHVSQYGINFWVLISGLLYSWEMKLFTHSTTHYWVSMFLYSMALCIVCLSYPSAVLNHWAFRCFYCLFQCKLLLHTRACC